MPRPQVVDMFGASGTLDGHASDVGGVWSLVPSGTFPEYGLVNGGDTAVFTPAGRVRRSAGAGNSQASLYLNDQVAGGSMQDLFFDAYCATSENGFQVAMNFVGRVPGSPVVYPGFYLNVVQGPSLVFSCFIDGVNFPFGGPSAETFIGGQAGRTYKVHMASRPEACYVYIDGLLVMTTFGLLSMGITNDEPGGLMVRMDSDVGTISNTTGWHLDNVKWFGVDPYPARRQMSTALMSHIQEDVQTLAMLAKVTRRDGTVLGFTTHDRPLTVGGTTYHASDGVLTTALRVESGVGVDSMDVTGELSSSRVTEDDMRVGVYDNAQMQVQVCNWTDLTQGAFTLARGNIGDITVSDGKFVASFRSLMQRFRQQVGEVYSPTCRVKQLGDSRCKVNLAGDTAGGYPITGSGWIHLARTDRAFSLTNTNPSAGPAGGLVFNAGFYDYGTVTVTSGPNAGMSREVKTHTFGIQTDTEVTRQCSVGAAFTLGWSNNPQGTDAETTKTFSVPDGTWSSAFIEVRSTWATHTGVGPTDMPTDVMVVEVPAGIANRVVVRQANQASTYVDYLDATDAALDAINAAAGGTLTVKFRHQAQNSGGSQGSDVKVDSAVLFVEGVQANIGSSFEVIIAEAFPFPVSADTAVTVVAGCDRLPFTCRTKYDNVVNIRCEPDLPGNSVLLVRGRS